MFSDQTLFHYSLLSLYIAAPFTAFSLLFLQAPYGKHRRPGWGTTISPPLAWFLMESPTLWLTLLLFPLGQNHSNPKSHFLISPFLFHFPHPTPLYPLPLHLKAIHRKTTSGFPSSVAAMAFFFNLWNSYLQARWVSHYATYENDGWFWWRFAGGMVVFVSGFAVNVWSDMVLVGLKSEGGGGYKVPRGGWFEVVSCPNYLGEIVEWSGWAFMTWSWAGLGFFLYTCANLMPRAQAHHKWYLEKFGEDYPKNRKAVIPFVY
ncbi:Steroid 5-alpha-reductase DET2 [Camellia lanceoleosa]|uniref:Steroid 5-alpha-reductase DET2 n=1 Tax=Camellia lanceoleosa TaxID=1840588 RepID=A0ACC0HQJ0_9ERIC|nr:Steroid 5-alpha-reductase DET2 [Camellia lanceoleosa]